MTHSEYRLCPGWPVPDFRRPVFRFRLPGGLLFFLHPEVQPHRLLVFPETPSFSLLPSFAFSIGSIVHPQTHCLQANLFPWEKSLAHPARITQKLTPPESPPDSTLDPPSSITGPSLVIEPNTFIILRVLITSFEIFCLPAWLSHQPRSTRGGPDFSLSPRPGAVGSLLVLIE